MRNMLPYTKSARPPNSLAKQSDGGLGAILARRSGANADAVQVATITVAMWNDIAAALQSIIGNHGFAALYYRSAVLTAHKYPWLAPSRAQDDPLMVFARLQSIVAAQSRETAMRGAAQLFHTFYGILAGLLGPVLCEQLLASVRDSPAYADCTLSSRER
jgi:hypothetical protein